MLKLIEIEFLKLKRRKMVWLMLFVAFLMPVMMFLYVKALKKSEVQPALFFRWSALGFPGGLFLPIILGIFCTMIMYNENQNDMLKQLWIVPISRMQYFISKFCLVMFYSISFMVLTCIATLISGKLSGSVSLGSNDILFLIHKCIEYGVFTVLAMLPILAIAASQKGYILPACLTVLYVLAYFIFGYGNSFIHPLSSINVICLRNNDIPGVRLVHVSDIKYALLSLFVWDVASLVLANNSLKRR